MTSVFGEVKTILLFLFLVRSYALSMRDVSGDVLPSIGELGQIMAFGDINGDRNTDILFAFGKFGNTLHRHAIAII